MERKHPANLFVRDCITKALFKLMKNKDYQDITVSAIVRTAGVSRNSFYRNYQSIEDILRQYLIEQTSRWWEEYLAHLHPNVIEETFQHFLNMREEILLLYKAGLSHLLMEHIALCGKQSLTGEISNAYQTAFMSGGLWGLTNEWILRGMKETPQQMQALFLTQGQQGNI
ncbi:MAG: TetR/AcrR family transcriptional regulator [Candidatus Fimadaptatus sp.]